MRYLALIIVMLFATAQGAAADQLCFSWTPNSDDVTEQYHIYENTRDTTVAEIDHPTAEACIPRFTEDGCRNYFATALGLGSESGNSEVVKVCSPDPDNPPLPTQPPTTVGGFTVRIIVEPIGE